MTPADLRTELARLGLSQRGGAAYLRVNEKTMRRWISGEIPIPHAIALLLPKLKPKDVAS